MERRLLDSYDHLSTEEILQALVAASSENELLKWWDCCYGSPNNPEPDWQRRYYDAGAFAKQRLLMAANGVGKSQTICAELAGHCTGMYPEWWKGVRFERGGFEVWIGSIDNNMQKRGPQRALLGRDLNEFLGTGLIPKSSIVSLELRQAGVKEVADTTVVKHASGDNIIIKWLTFEQGWRKWQSGDPKIILWDEEPDDTIADQKDILSETLTRLVRNSGIWLVGYTPLLGDTGLTEHFMNSEDPKVFWIGASWADAPHMDEDDKRTIESQYKTKAEKDARARGVPMLGEGVIFDADESQIICDPFDIPDHWARIHGIDFGGTDGHKHGIGSIAWDRDKDIVYVYDCWTDNCKTRDHAHAINTRGKWIPVAWPHDGMKHDPGSAKRFYAIYRDSHEVNMLSRSARYKNDEGGAQAQWPVIETIKDREDAGTFKVFRTCQTYLKERRSYHMKDGKIVSRRDDGLKSVFYAIMMLRFSRSKMEGVRKRHRSQPSPLTTHA